MPTYAYRCRDCGHQFDIFQKFSEDSLTVCPTCEGSIRRVIQPTGIVFKGTGFYINDSRNSPKSGADKAKTAADASDSSDGEKRAGGDKADGKADKADGKADKADGKADKADKPASGSIEKVAAEKSGGKAETAAPPTRDRTPAAARAASE